MAFSTRCATSVRRNSHAGADTPNRDRHRGNNYGDIPFIHFIIKLLHLYYLSNHTTVELRDRWFPGHRRYHVSRLPGGRMLWGTSGAVRQFDFSCLDVTTAGARRDRFRCIWPLPITEGNIRWRELEQTLGPLSLGAVTTARTRMLRRMGEEPDLRKRGAAICDDLSNLLK